MSEVRQQPMTVDEWQEAALLATAWRLIHDARLYGFIEGGPEVNAERCDEIIDEAKSVGIHVDTEEAQQLAAQLVQPAGDTAS